MRAGRPTFLRAILNSALVGVAATVLSVLFGASASYALARFNFLGRSRLGPKEVRSVAAADSSSESSAVGAAWGILASHNSAIIDTVGADRIKKESGVGAGAISQRFAIHEIERSGGEKFGIQIFERSRVGSFPHMVAFESQGSKG